MDVNIIKGKCNLTNVGDDYSGTLSVGESVYVNSAVYICKISATNTTIGSTLNLNSIGPRSIFNNYGYPCYPGELRAGAWGYFLFESATNRFILANPALIDTGWIDLQGFSYMPLADRPEYRVIGREIYFRGSIVIPLSNDGGTTLVPYTGESSYRGQFFKAPYTGAGGGVTLNPNGSMSFNQGSPVIPNTSHYPDGSYSSVMVFATRRVDSDVPFEEILYHAPINISITSSGAIIVGDLFDVENFSGDKNVGSSSMRAVTSNVISGGNTAAYTGKSVSLLSQATSITTGVSAGDAMSGVITTQNATAAAGASHAFTVSLTNGMLTTDSIVKASIVNYSGTAGANGYPSVIIDNIQVTPAQFDIIIINNHSGNALSGTLKIAFEVTKIPDHQHQISIDAGRVTDLGGFVFSLSGLRAFLAPL